MSNKSTILKKEEVNKLTTLLRKEQVINRIKEVVGKNAGVFTTSLIQIQKSNKLLIDAEPNSIVAAALTAATLNLPLNNNLGYAYIIPFKEKQSNGTYLTKAQFQIGYKGFYQLAMRSGQFKTIHATDVREGEIESRDRLTGEINFRWIDDDNVRERSKVIGYVAYFRLSNGFESYLYLSYSEMQAHAHKFSQTYKKGFGLWNTDFDMMAQKTVLKLLLSKKAPLSIDMQNAVKYDQAAINDIQETEDISYVDNTVEEIDPDKERITLLIQGAKNQDELDFAKGLKETTEEFLPLIKEKQKELNQSSKKPLSDNAQEKLNLK
jgi:recombination protein RecT